MPVINEAGDSASVNVINNLNADLSSTVVYVVITDSTGKIVGGGSAQSGSLRANSSITVQIPIVFIGTIENLKLNASVGIPLDVTVGP